MFPANVAVTLNFTIAFFAFPFIIIAFVLLLAGIAVAATHPRWRKPTGLAMVALGILEMIPFLLDLFGLGPKGMVVPPQGYAIVLVEGCVTLAIGVVFIFLGSRKPKRQPM